MTVAKINLVKKDHRCKAGTLKKTQPSLGWWLVLGLHYHILIMHQKREFRKLNQPAWNDTAFDSPFGFWTLLLWWLYWMFFFLNQSRPQYEVPPSCMACCDQWINRSPRQEQTKINGHFRNLDWRYLPYIRPIFQAYVREYPHKIWPYMIQYLHFRILEFPLKKRIAETARSVLPEV